MKIWFHWFNIYFVLSVVLFAGGCSSNHPGSSKKEESTIRLYLEGNRTELGSVGTVLVTREKIPFIVDREPFLTEADVVKARLVEDPGADGGYSIQLGFNEHGMLLMDMVTTANKGRHIIVFSQFPVPGQKAPKAPKKPKKSDDDSDEEAPAPSPPPESPGKPRQSAWLGAVLIQDRNETGTFRFTPDATHEEGARIVRGLKNVIAEAKKADTFKMFTQ